MAKVKIKGWESGFKKVKLAEMLVEKLMLDEAEALKMETAVSAGRAISLEIDDEDFASDLYEDLIDLGALAEIE